MGAKLCITPGCYWPTTGGARCPRHESEHQRTRNADPARKPRRTRAYMQTELGPFCVCCGATDDLTRHHVIALARGDWTRQVELVTLCRRCNSSIGSRVVEGMVCPLHGGTYVSRETDGSDVSRETHGMGGA